MNTLTELHTPHHHHHQHHHILASNPSELYLSAEQQQQQLIQINNMLHKHENPILQSHQHQQADQQQMLLYQVNQNGQIMELNQIHQPSHSLGSRLYKSDMIELDGMHGIQQNLAPTMNENITIIGGEGFQRTLTSEHLNQPESVVVGHVKKRKGERGEGTKAYQKELSEKIKLIFKNQLLNKSLFRVNKILSRHKVQKEASNSSNR